MRTILGRRISASMGVVNDTRFIRCFWPAFDQPTSIFAAGSSGLIVQGPPAPANIVFPDDTIFPDYFPDADSVACVAAMAASNGTRTGLVNATQEMVDAYLKAYAEEAARLPATAAKHRTRDDCHFLVQWMQIGISANGKPIFDRYVAQISKQAASDICKGVITPASLQPLAVYCKDRDNPLRTTTNLYQLKSGTMTQVSAAVATTLRSKLIAG